MKSFIYKKIIYQGDNIEVIPTTDAEELILDDLDELREIKPQPNLKMLFIQNCDILSIPSFPKLEHLTLFKFIDSLMIDSQPKLRTMILDRVDCLDHGDYPCLENIIIRK